MMSTTSDKKLTSLGLEPSSICRGFESARRQDSGTGRGRPAGEALEYYAQPMNMDAEPVDLPLFEAATGARVLGHRRTGGVAYLQAPRDQVEVMGRTAWADPEHLVIDAREDKAEVRLGRQWLTYLLQFDGSQIDVGVVDRSELARVTEPVPAATADHLLAGLPTEDWLRRLVEVRATLPSSWSRATGAGLAARLWSPPRPGMVRLDELRRSGSPATRAVAWYAALPEAHRRALATEALRCARELEGKLDEAVRSAEAEPPMPPPALLDFLLCRDDVESLLVLIPPGERGELSRILGGADRAAAINWSSLSAYRWPDDRRLGAVARVSPDEWWGRLSAQ